MLRRLLVGGALVLATAAGHAQSARQLSDEQVAIRVMKESRLAYYHTGHPCACPDDLARNGSRCGRRSAYSRPGGADPKCYVDDVSPADIAAYRSRHLRR